MFLSLHFYALIRPLIHYGFHFILPFFIAWIFYKKRWKKVGLLMMATIIVDVDHLMASPVFDPNRCSINFHPLHTFYAIVVYFVFLFFPKTRIIGIGLLLHMFTDALDCLWL